MIPTALSDPAYHDDEAARRHLEAIRWPNGAVSCPLCGVADQARPLAGKSMGAGWFYCGACKDKFTVRTGSVMERSHIALHKWLLGFRLFASSKKGFSAHQLHRTLGITYKSAWFMAMRIREAMKDDGSPLGGPGVTVEADETVHGRNDYVFVTGKGWQEKKGSATKQHKIVSLVERGGRARSIQVEDIDLASIRDALSHVDPVSRLHTDAAAHYKSPGKRFAKHESVNHSVKEYARGDVTTNTVEGFFSIFKRGMIGTYQHCSEKHLQRYLTEFDFRYSHRSALGIEDAERATIAVKGAAGKRLRYRNPGGRKVA